MQFQRSTLIALFSAVVAYAQSNANPFNVPTSGFSPSAGEPVTLSWKPTTSGTVTLILRSGSSNNLSTGTVIQSGLSNSGSYTWTPSTSLPAGSDYTIEIVSDSDPNAYNFYPQFTLTNDNPTAVTSLTSSISLPTSSITLSTVSASSTSVSTTSSTDSSSSSTTSSASGSTTSSASTSGSSSTTRSSQTTSTDSGAGFASTSGTPNAAPRATAMAGLLGVVALGALAL